MIGVLKMARTKGSKGKKGKGKKKSRVISVDMEGVEAGGGRIKDGEYLATIEEVEVKEGNDSGEDYLSFIFNLDGAGKIYHNCSLQPHALFALRAVLEAVEMDVPDSSMDVDLDELIDMQCGILVANTEYQGKPKPEIVDLFLAEDLEEKDEEEEEKPKKGKKSKAKKDKKESKKEKNGKKEKKSKKKPKIKVGSDVVFDDDGDEMEGTVTEIDDDIVSVEDDEGDTWEVAMEDVSLAD